MADCLECKKKLAIIKKKTLINERKEKKLQLFRQIYSQVDPAKLINRNKDLKDKSVQCFIEDPNEGTNGLFLHQTNQNKKLAEEIANLRGTLKVFQTSLPQAEEAFKHINFVNKQLVSYHHLNERSLNSFKRVLRNLANTVLKNDSKNAKAKACLQFIKDLGRRPIEKHLKEIIATSDEPGVKKACEDLLHKSCSSPLSLESSGIGSDISDLPSVCSETSACSSIEFKCESKTTFELRTYSKIRSPAFYPESPQVDSVFDSDEEVVQKPVPISPNKSNSSNEIVIASSSCYKEKEFSTEENNFDKNTLETFISGQSCLNTKHQNESSKPQDFELGNYSLETNFSNFDCSIFNSLCDIPCTELPELENYLTDHSSPLKSSVSVNGENICQNSLSEQNSLKSYNKEIGNADVCVNSDSRFIPPRNGTCEIPPDESQNSIISHSSVQSDSANENESCNASLEKPPLYSEGPLSFRRPILPNSNETIELGKEIDGNCSVNNILNETKVANNELPSMGDQSLILTQPNATSKTLERDPNCKNLQIETSEETHDPNTSHAQSDTSEGTQDPNSSHNQSDTSEETQDPNSSHNQSNTSEGTQDPNSSHNQSDTSEETQDLNSSHNQSNTSEETQDPNSSHNQSDTLEETQDPNILNTQKDTSEETQEESSPLIESCLLEPPCLEASKQNSTFDRSSFESSIDKGLQFKLSQPLSNGSGCPIRSDSNELVCSNNSDSGKQKSALTCERNLPLVNSLFNPLLEDMNENSISFPHPQETMESDSNDTSDYLIFSKYEGLEFNSPKNKKHGNSALSLPEPIVGKMLEENQNKSISSNKYSKVVEEILVSSENYHASDENNVNPDQSNTTRVPVITSFNVIHVENRRLPEQKVLNKSTCTEPSVSKTDKSDKENKSLFELESLQEVPRMVSPIHSVRSIEDSSDTELADLEEGNDNHEKDHDNHEKDEGCREGTEGPNASAESQKVFGDIHCKSINRKPILKKAVLHNLTEKNDQNNTSQTLQSERNDNSCKLGVKKTSDLLSTGNDGKYETPLFVNCTENKNKQPNEMFTAPFMYIRSNVFAGTVCCGQRVKSEVSSPNENLDSGRNKRSTPHFRNPIQDYPYVYHDYYENYEMPILKYDSLNYEWIPKSHIFSCKRSTLTKRGRKSLNDILWKTWQSRGEDFLPRHNLKMEKGLPSVPVFSQLPQRYVNIGAVIKQFDSLSLLDKNIEYFLFSDTIKRFKCGQKETNVFPSQSTTFSSEKKPLDKNIFDGVPSGTRLNEVVASKLKPSFSLGTDDAFKFGEKPLFTHRTQSKCCDTASTSVNGSSVNSKKHTNSILQLNRSSTNQNNERVFPAVIQKPKLIETNNKGSSNEEHDISTRGHQNHKPRSCSSGYWSNVSSKKPGHKEVLSKVCLEKSNLSEKVNTTLNIKGSTETEIVHNNEDMRHLRKNSCESTNSNGIDNIKSIFASSDEFTSTQSVFVNTSPLQSNTVTHRTKKLNEKVHPDKRKFENSKGDQEPIKNVFSDSPPSKKTKISSFSNFDKGLPRNENSSSNEFLCESPNKNENGTNNVPMVNQHQFTQHKKISFKLPSCTKRVIKDPTKMKYPTNKNDSVSKERETLPNKPTSSEFLNKHEISSHEKSDQSLNNNNKININETLILESRDAVQPLEMPPSSPTNSGESNLLSGPLLFKKSQIDDESALQKTVTISINGHGPTLCNNKKDDSLSSQEHNSVQLSIEKIDPPEMSVSYKAFETDINKVNAEVGLNSPKNNDVFSICSDSALQKDGSNSSEEIFTCMNDRPLPVPKGESIREAAHLDEPNKVLPTKEQASYQKEKKASTFSKPLLNECIKVNYEEHLNRLPDKHEVFSVSDESYANKNINRENLSSSQETDFGAVQSPKSNNTPTNSENRDEKDNKIKIDKSSYIQPDDQDSPTPAPSRKRISHVNNKPNKSSIVGQLLSTNDSNPENSISSYKNININMKTIKKNEKITYLKRRKEKMESLENDAKEKNTFKKPKLQTPERKTKGKIGSSLCNSEKDILEDIFDEMKLVSLLSPLPASPDLEQSHAERKINKLRKTIINDKDSINDKNCIVTTSEISLTVNDNIKTESCLHKADVIEDKYTEASVGYAVSSTVNISEFSNSDLKNGSVFEDLELSSENDMDTSEIVGKADDVTGDKIFSSPLQQDVEHQQNPLNNLKYEQKSTTAINEYSVMRTDLQKSIENNTSLSERANNCFTNNEIDLKSSLLQSFSKNVKKKDIHLADETIDECKDIESTIWLRNSQGVPRAYPGKNRLAPLNKPNTGANLTLPHGLETCFKPQTINMVKQEVLDINISDDVIWDIENKSYSSLFFDGIENISIKQEGRDIEITDKCKSEELYENKVKKSNSSKDDIHNSITDNKPKRHNIPQIVPDYMKSLYGSLISSKNSRSSSIKVRNENAPVYSNYKGDSRGSSYSEDNNTNTSFEECTNNANGMLQINETQSDELVPTKYKTNSTVVKGEEHPSNSNYELPIAVKSFYKDLSVSTEPVIPETETTTLKTENADEILDKKEEIRNNHDENIQNHLEGNPSETNLEKNNVQTNLEKLKPPLPQYKSESWHKNICNVEVIDCSRNIFHSTIKYIESKVIAGEEKCVPRETKKEKEAEQVMKLFIQKEIYRIMHSACKFTAAKKIVKSLKNNTNMVLMPKPFARAVCDTIAAEKEQVPKEKPAMGKNTLSCSIFTMLYVGRKPNEFLLEVLRVIEEVLGSYHDRTLTVTIGIRIAAYYTAVCQAYSLDMRVKHLIIDLIYSRYFKCSGIILKILEIWPEILVYRTCAVREDCLLTQTIVSLLLSTNKDMQAASKKNASLLQQTYCSKSLKEFLRSYFGYHCGNFTSNHKELIEKCLARISSEDARKSLILMCHCAGYVGATSVISNQMFPILEGWIEGKVPSSIALDVLVTSALVIRGMPLAKPLMFVNRTLLLYKKILHKSPDAIFAERVIESIFYLRRHNILLCFDIIMNYTPPFRSMTKNTVKYVRGIISASKIKHWLKVYQTSNKRFIRI